MIKELHKKYGGFIDDQGFLVLQCPFHKDRFPSVLVWVEDGALRFKCLQGCDENRLRTYFIGGYEKVGYNPDWRNVREPDIGMGQEWSKKARMSFLCRQMKNLSEIKFRLKNLNKKLLFNTCWFGDLTAVRAHKVRAFIKLLVDVIDDEIARCKKAMDWVNKKDDFYFMNTISDAEIERAREVPFTRIYEFKNRMALCPFHNDKDPSLVLW